VPLFDSLQGTWDEVPKGPASRQSSSLLCSLAADSKVLTSIWTKSPYSLGRSASALLTWCATAESVYAYVFSDQVLEFVGARKSVPLTVHWTQGSKSRASKSLILALVAPDTLFMVVETGEGDMTGPDFHWFVKSNR
jgi:hypothetical protein